MCGIVGVVGNFTDEQGRATAAKMNAQIRHRGPDDEGLWATGGFAFGMRRLSIIDLEGGRQPIFTAEGNGIVFNGEIYNFQEIRESLIADGISFTTRSDTEVVLRLYQAQGLEGLKRLEGMFAICLWDKVRRQVHLIRDRLGMKPLYFACNGGKFYFASEIRSILAVLPQKPSINRQSLSHYFTLRYVPGPDTIWDGIQKLPPAHSLTVNANTLAMQMARYWHCEFFSNAEESGRDYAEEFESLFKTTVQKQLLASDVPVGVLLSGGLDSSAIAATARELGHRNFHTFNVFFEEGGAFSERGYAQQVAAHVGSIHHEVSIGKKQFLEFLPQMVKSLEEPLADLASIPMYFVCHLARQHVKVVLAGEGSDEVLAGYSFERYAQLIDRHRALLAWVPAPFRSSLGKLSGKYFSTEALLRARAYHLSYYWNSADKRRLLKQGSPLATEALIQSWYGLTGSREPIDQVQQSHLESWLVEDLLMKADKMSMANSLEVRVPFLEHPIVEWAAKLPLQYKVGNRKSGYRSKRILRDFCASRLPKEILDRPKQGFPVPAYEWLKGESNGWAAEFVLSANSRSRQFLEILPIKESLARAKNGDQGAAHRVWSVIVFEQWLREWT